MIDAIYHWKRERQARERVTDPWEYVPGSGDELWVSPAWAEYKAGPEEAAFWVGIGGTYSVTRYPNGTIDMEGVSPTGLARFVEFMAPYDLPPVADERAEAALEEAEGQRTFPAEGSVLTLGTEHQVMLDVDEMRWL